MGYFDTRCPCGCTYDNITHKYCPKCFSGLEGEWVDYPTCPKCGSADHDWWDGEGFKNDGDWEETVCEECGLAYRTTMCISTTFKNDTLIGRDVHILRHNCAVCGKGHPSEWALDKGVPEEEADKATCEKCIEYFKRAREREAERV